jgi:hypothetical protein
MILDIALKLVTIVSVLVGAVAIYIALRNDSRQIGAHIFLTYADRIHDLRRRGCSRSISIIGRGKPTTL